MIPEFEIPFFADQTFNQLQFVGDYLFVGSTNHISSPEARKFPLLCYLKTASGWTYQGVTYGNAAVGDDDQFGGSLAAFGDKLLIGAILEGHPVDVGQCYMLQTNTLSRSELVKPESHPWPNPSHEFVYLPTQADSAMIFDLGGKLLMKTENTSSLSLINFARGTYILKTVTNDETQTFKLLKN